MLSSFRSLCYLSCTDSSFLALHCQLTKAIHIQNKLMFLPCISTCPDIEPRLVAQEHNVEVPTWSNWCRPNFNKKDRQTINEWSLPFNGGVTKFHASIRRNLFELSRTQEIGQWNIFWLNFLRWILIGLYKSRITDQFGNTYHHPVVGVILLLSNITSNCIYRSQVKKKEDQANFKW